MLYEVITDIINGERPSIQVLTDGIDGNSAGVALGYLARIAEEHQSELLQSEPALGRALRTVRIVRSEPRITSYNVCYTKLLR